MLNGMPNALQITPDAHLSDKDREWSKIKSSTELLVLGGKWVQKEVEWMGVSTTDRLIFDTFHR